MALAFTVFLPYEAHALRLFKPHTIVGKLFGVRGSSSSLTALAPRVDLKCKPTDYRCLRKQRDLDFRRCVKMKGPFGVKSCQDQRKKSALGAASLAQQQAYAQVRAQRAATLVPQGPVRMNSAEAASMIPQMERMGRRSSMGTGPSMGGIGGRSMVRRAQDNSHLVARQAQYRSNGRNRSARRMATQGRAVSQSISAAHQRLVDQRNAAAAERSAAVGSRSYVPRSAFSARNDPFRSRASYSRYPASISSAPMPRESAPLGYSGR